MTTLLVANDGGHITQIHRLRNRLGLGSDVIFVTVRTPQTESLLAGEEVFWVPPSPTRDVTGLLRNVRTARHFFATHQVDHAISTGAALALAFLPQARLKGIRTYYIESATRTHGPSVSGRVLSRLPGITSLNQNDSWGGRQWSFLESPWENYRMERVAPPSEIRRAVVALGTQDRFSFDRAVARLVEILPSDCEVLWQTGSTDVSRFDIDGRHSVPSAELHAAITEADVVVSHAGTGATLSAFSVGKCPVLLPRRPQYDEHVDEHQVHLATDIGRHDLAVVREADQVTLDDLFEAASRRIHTIQLPTLQLPGW